MTDLSSRRARWTTAALVAPLSAAAFAGATMWTLDHDPFAAASSTAAATGPVADPEITDLRAAVSRSTAELAVLQTQVRSIRKQAVTLRVKAAALTKDAAAKAAAAKAAAAAAASSYSSSSGGSSSSSSGGSSSSSSGGSSSSSSSSGSSAPASNGSTGASGAK